MPSVEKAQELLQNKKIEFLFASNETADQIEKFKTLNGYSFNYVRVETSVVTI